MTFLRRRVLLVLLAAAPLLAVAQPGPSIVQLDDPAEAFRRVEQFMRYAQHITIDQASVDTDSAFTAELVGRWRLGPQNRADILMAGIFYDFNMDSRPMLLSDGVTMKGGRSDEVSFDTTTAPHLRDALAVGFMRMGLLHNLVQLHTGSPPDRAYGGVEEWVTVHSFSWRPEVRIRGRAARPMHFTIRVSGEDSAEATLYFDAETGLPLYRTQTVAFASSQMNVEEAYWGWTLLPPYEDPGTKTNPGDEPSGDDPSAQDGDPDASGDAHTAPPPDGNNGGT